MCQSHDKNGKPNQKNEPSKDNSLFSGITIHPINIWVSRRTGWSTKPYDKPPDIDQWALHDPPSTKSEPITTLWIDHLTKSLINPTLMFTIAFLTKGRK